MPRMAGARGPHRRVIGAMQGSDGAYRRTCPYHHQSTSATTRHTWLPIKWSSQKRKTHNLNAGFASTRRSSTTSHTWSAHNTAPQRLWRSGLTPSSASPVQPNQERSFNVQGKGPAQATTPQQRSSGTCAQATSCGTSRLRSTT